MKKLILSICAATLIGITFSCSKSEDSNPTAETPGPKFLAAKSVVSGSCALSGCHISPSNSGGLNLESNSGIVSAGNRIKVRAVDEGTMPPTGQLSATDKAKIADWITAGGRLTD